MASIIKADTLQSTTANVFVLNSSGTEYARFDSTGVFQLTNPTTFPAGTVSLPSITTSGDTNTGLYFPAADTIAFTEGGVESMRIDASGNLGLGVTSPSSYSSLGNRLVVGDGAGNEGITIATGTGDNGSLLFADGTSGSAAFAGYVQYDHSDNSMKFGTNGSERGRFNSTGALVFAGGTTTADGIGITFPATQSASTNANTLDDYEEGSWTPVFQNAGTGTYSAQTGRYIKIGSQVFAYFHLSLGTLGTASGALKIIGLPFTSVNISANYGTVSSIHANSFVTARTGELNTLIVPNTATTTEFFYGMASTGSLTLSHADMGATGNLLGCLIYQAA